jgi:hypothetical protein
MKNITQHEGVLRVLERLPNSFYGNPRYLISIDGFKCKTPVDSSYGYSVTNYNGKVVGATIGTHYRTATLKALWEIIND